MVALDWKYSKRERRKRSEFFLTLEYRFHWIDSKTDCKIFTINNLEVATIKKRFKVYIQFNSVTQSCLTLCDSMDCSTPAFPIHQQLLGLSQTHVHWVSDAVQPSHPLSSPFPPAFNLSQHQGLSNESVLLIRWPKHWSFSFSISPSNEYSGLISFRIDWLDLLTVQETLKSLLQHHRSKELALQHSAFFIV